MEVAQDRTVVMAGLVAVVAQTLLVDQGRSAREMMVAVDLRTAQEAQEEALAQTAMTDHSLVLRGR